MPAAVQQEALARRGGTTHEGRGHGSESAAPEVARIALHGVGGVRAHALVDADMARDLVDGPRWHLTSTGYARRRRRGGGYDYMHRLVAGLVAGDGLQVDHINRDKLDNRRANLRVVTHLLNGQNLGAIGGTSRHRGVFFDRGTGRWRVRVRVLRADHDLGRFDTEEQAAAAADAAYERLLAGAGL